MARLALGLALACAALATPAAANAKEFASLVLVGARGDSVTLRPPSETIDRLYRNASSRVPARGPFVKLYPLGRGGFPAMPGRFYVQSRAVCMGWNGLASTRCFRPGATLLGLLRAGRRLAPFGGSVGALARLTPGDGDLNLRAAVELAFERFRLARAAARPARCIPLVAAWRAAATRLRPARFCLSRQGIHARGRLYPLGSAVWAISGVQLQ